MTHENKTALLDAEIINCIAGVGKATQHQVSKNILAPETTVRYRLRKLVENGRLDCTETRLSKIFTIPDFPSEQTAQPIGSVPKHLIRQLGARRMKVTRSGLVASKKEQE